MLKVTNIVGWKVESKAHPVTSAHHTLWCLCFSRTEEGTGAIFSSLPGTHPVFVWGEDILGYT